MVHGDLLFEPSLIPLHFKSVTVRDHLNINLIDVENV